MRRFLFAIAALGSLVAPSIANATCDSGEYPIRMSHANRMFDHPIGDAATELARRVNEEFNGVACMEVFGNSILYTDEQVTRALLSGDVHIAVPNFGSVDQLTPQLRVFSLPFVFKNLAAVEDFQNSLTGELLKNALIGKGIRGMGFWHNGMHQIVGNKQVTSVEDLSGMKLRITGSIVSQNFAEAANAEPVMLAFAETYRALNDSTIDATEETWANIEGKDLFKAGGSVTETNHSVGGGIVLVNNSWWKSLNGAFASRLGAIITEVSEAQNKEVFEKTEAAKQRVADQGGQIAQLSQADRDAWAAELKPLWDQFSKDVHPRLIGYIDAVNARN